MFVFVIVLFAILCLLTSAAVAVYVAYPGQDRPVPETLSSVAARRPADRRAQELRQ